MTEDYDLEESLEKAEAKATKAEAEAREYKQRAEKAEGQLAELSRAEQEGPTVEELDAMSMSEYVKWRKEHPNEDWRG